MKQSLIYIVAALVLLSSCGRTNPVVSQNNGNSTSLQQMIEQQKEQEKTTSLTLQTEKTTLQGGDMFVVHVVLDNPKNEEIDSVRSWLTFDPTKVQVVALDETKSDFDLAMSDEKMFDNQKGIIAIGRSSTNIKKASSLIVMDISFQTLSLTSEAITAIDFYNYTPDTNGHTGVYHLVGDTPYNILKEPQNTSLRLTLLSNKIKR